MAWLIDRFKIFKSLITACLICLDASQQCVTTAGCGDIVPSSAPEKIFSGLLILFGLGLFSLITASLSAFLLAKDEEEIIRDEQEELVRLRRIEERMEKLERILKRVESSVSKDR